MGIKVRANAPQRREITVRHDGYGLWCWSIDCGSGVDVSARYRYQTPSAALRAARAWERSWLRPRAKKDAAIRGG